ncbi:MAG: ATP-binding cassette domain-containing protein [Syntrophomonadaceae bacterium]
MLKVQAITKSFGPQVVLDKVDLLVESEIKALIGINGSGKSTLLKIVCGIVESDSGQVIIDSRDVTHVPPEERNVGYVPQHPALFSNLTIRDNVRYGMRKGRGSEKTYERLVDMLDLREVLDKKPGQVSGGYKHRASLARALAPQPVLLMLDEPLNGMDAVLKEKLVPEFRIILKNLGVPVLFVTHNPEEAQALADSFAAIIDGSIKAMESTDQAFGEIKVLAHKHIGRAHIV